MPNHPTKRELAAAYRRLGTVTAVAGELGVAFETARRWLVAAGVQVQPKGRPSKSAERLSTAGLVQEYAAGSSIATLGQLHGVSPATIRARLIEAGVELRPRRGWQY